MSYSTTQRSTLRTRVRERLLSTFWTDAELNAYINEALRVWNVCTGYNRNAYASVSFASGSFGYTIASKAASGMFLQRIEKSDLTHLDQLSISELNAMDNTWVTGVSTTPGGWLMIGANQIFIYPKLSATLSGTTVYTVDVMTVPTSDSDYIQVGEEDLPFIIDYAVFVARLKEGGKETQDAVALLQGFLQQAAKYNAKILQTSLYKKVLGLNYQAQTRQTALEQKSSR